MEILKMRKEENVIRYYVLCNKLKSVIRTGWKDWHVNAERIESVAEHIYGVQMLAIAIQSEYQYNIDLNKVIMMLAVHELEEILIGDLTQFQISKAEKIIIGHKAVEDVLGDLLYKDEIKNLILEFDERKSSEALFAHYCDKLECDLQSRIYDEKGYVDLKNQEGNETYNDPTVQKYIKSNMSWSEMWLKYGQEKYNYDENFKKISDYALTHKIIEFQKNQKDVI
jgi:metal-dependent phosphohydrolase, HD superfamily